MTTLLIAIVSAVIGTAVGWSLASGVYYHRGFHMGVAAQVFDYETRRDGDIWSATLKSDPRMREFGADEAEAIGKLMVTVRQAVSESAEDMA